MFIYKYNIKMYYWGCHSALNTISQFNIQIYGKHMVYSNNIYEQYFYCIYKQMFSFNANKIKII